MTLVDAVAQGGWALNPAWLGGSRTGGLQPAGWGLALRGGRRRSGVGAIPADAVEKPAGRRRKLEQIAGHIARKFDVAGRAGDEGGNPGSRTRRAKGARAGSDIWRRPAGLWRIAERGRDLGAGQGCGLGCRTGRRWATDAGPTETLREFRPATGVFTAAWIEPWSTKRTTNGWGAHRPSPPSPANEGWPWPREAPFGMASVPAGGIFSTRAEGGGSNCTRHLGRALSR